MENSTQYEIRENEGRQKLKALISSRNDSIKVNFTTNQYACFDASWTFKDANNEDVNVIAEIKVRSKDFDSFIIEKSKLERLQLEAKRMSKGGKKYLIYYINFCDNVAYFHNVTTLKYWFSGANISINRNTVRSLTDKATKAVYFLPSNKAQKIEID